VSLHWAQRTLDLLAAGRLGRAGTGLVHADRHLPDLLLQEGWTLAEAAARRRLAPLTALGPHRGSRLALTMLECLKHGFNATDAAEALCVHPQTVRYRLAQLHEMFGFDIEDPEIRLEMMLLLHTWIQRNGG
jgi:DNA-binding PucR family transcriptional regulator